MDANDAGDTAGTDIDGFFTTARISGREDAVELTDQSYRSFLLDLDDPRLAEVRGMTYEEFAQDRYRAPFLRELLELWDGLYREPYVGITTDGVPVRDLYRLPDTPVTDDAAVAAAARRVLDTLTPGEADAVRHPIDSPHWRAWSNPEFVVYRVGLRLEVGSEETVAAVHALMGASLSAEGYARVAEGMALNGYLGELVDLPRVMNDRSYWFALYGEPDPVEPWGWQLFGHHVAVNFVSVGGRQVVSPVFIGGEPALTDAAEGADGARPSLFDARERLALELADSLDADQRARAVVYASVLDPGMPEGRLHPADERHVAGAFRDNRVIPYEGIRAVDLDERQRSLLREIVADALLLLAGPQRDLGLAEFDEHLAETWFSWYGATDGTQPFYVRVHSPVLIAELDHHAGVWLDNRLPARFHVHTTLRHPNGNDYGKALIARWREGRDSGRG
jgi:hypothetical protein